MRCIHSNWVCYCWVRSYSIWNYKISIDLTYQFLHVEQCYEPPTDGKKITLMIISSKMYHWNLSNAIFLGFRWPPSSSWPYCLELGRWYIADIFWGGLCLVTARPSTLRPEVKELRNPLAMFFTFQIWSSSAYPPFAFPSFFPKFLGLNERLGRK